MKDLTNEPPGPRGGPNSASSKSEGAFGDSKGPGLEVIFLMLLLRVREAICTPGVHDPLPLAQPGATLPRNKAVNWWAHAQLTRESPTSSSVETRVDSDSAWGGGCVR